MEVAEKVKKVKRVITRKRIEISEEIATVDSLGEEGTTIMPEELAVMYAGKIANTTMKGLVAATNTIAGYKRAYGDQITPEIEAELNSIRDDFEEGFAKAKKRVTKIADETPLWKKLGGIKGFSSYQLALIMAQIKDISRFAHPSALCMYAGCASKNNVALSKATINTFKEMYDKEGKVFAGFNTDLAQRMHITWDTMLKSGGWFYNYYKQLRVRLEKRALEGGECFVATTEQQKESKGVMKAGKHYMVGKNNYSLIMWSNNNAKRRCIRVLLHFIWTEWRLLRGLEVCDPYPISYLGHSTIIKLDEVLKADSVVRKRKPKIKPEME